MLNQANSFTLINPLTTIAESWIGPSSTTGIYFISEGVGIGGAPSVGVKLHVRQLAAAIVAKFELTAGGDAGVYITSTGGSNLLVTDASGAFLINDGTDCRFAISGGKVGIGKRNPVYLLEVNTDSAGKPGAGGLWTVVSDERLKEKIELANLERCYEIVRTLPLKRFTFRDTCFTNEQIRDRSALGWIAQDVRPIFSKAVGVRDFTLPKPKNASEDYKEETIKDCLDLDAGQIYSAMYGAVQKLQIMVEAQQKEISLLMGKN
jgi:hypothetical protein